MKRCTVGRACGVAMCAIAMAVGAECVAGVVHVDDAAPGGGDGGTWETAFNDLGVGLAAAQPGDEVWVAAGVYVPATVFRLPAQAGVYGGFAGHEKTRGERDWIGNQTILSGDQNGDDEPDFVNYGDNRGPIVSATDAEWKLLDGFTVSGGNQITGAGGGLLSDEAVVTVRHCIFRRNMANVGGAAAFESNGAVMLDDCTFEENWAQHRGGGVDVTRAGLVTITRCRFADNAAIAGGGGAWVYEAFSIEVSDCEFRRNEASPAGVGSVGGLVTDAIDSSTVVNCLFAANKAGFAAGGLGVAGGRSTVINCSFSRNEATHGAGLITSGDWCTVINSTFASNVGITVEGQSDVLDVVNSIIWGNLGPVFDDAGEAPTVSYSDIEGGYPGDGNIDADPLYVQPGTDDLRLAFGSPCIDAGDNDAVPYGVDLDLDGDPRIQNGTVDMGAYEGEHDALPARAETEDADDGERVLLVPNGGGFDPESNTLVIFTNRSGEDDASASLAEYDNDRHPGARGFSALETTAVLETSVEDGAFLAQMFLSFHEDDLGGIPPLMLDLTYYDETVGNWALAVSRNTTPSPDQRGVIGDRIARLGPAPWGVTSEPGDYGVYFNTETRRGFVWANVDHAADFSAGVAFCPADAKQPPDSFIDFDDLLAVIDNWGAGPGPFDVNDDGTVDVNDVFAVLSAWGGCD